jgi:biopolymer transport protein ExbD
MPRVKVARKSTAIDMTAMCDVAFLLLTFFILSAKPKVADPVKADTPASTAIIQIPETDFAIITVGQENGVNKVFYTIEGDDVRRGTLEAMSETYGVKFTPDQVKAFAQTENIGAGIASMPQILSMTPAQSKGFKQPGIPIDTTETNDLAKWVLQSRKANAALHNKDLRIAIKSDKQELYPVVETIIKSLQKQKVDKFSLITSSLATAPKK